jgi:cytochrome c-type biogenesis protein
MEITFGLAFLAGLASFLSPCVIALVPVYLAYLTGRSVCLAPSEEKNPRLYSILHGGLFVLGFSFVFITLGLAFSAIGNLLYDARGVLEKIGGIVVVVFGLHITGLIKIRFLDYDFRPRNSGEYQRGFLSSFLLGVFFSAGWSPCVGPVLGSILVLAATSGEVSKGLWLLVSYSAGMAIPFLIAAVAVDWFTNFIRKHRQLLRVIEIGTGVLLIAMGVLLFLGVFETLARFGSPILNIGL